MTLSDFFRTRRIRKLASQFADLISRGETNVALALYESDLAQYEADLDKAIRVLYHLHRWIDLKTDQDARAVDALAADEPEDAPVAEAARCLRRLRRETDLAAALRQRNPEYPIAPSGPAHSPENLAMERLALAMLETYRPAGGQVSVNRVASAVEQLLPERTNLEGESRQAHDALLLWSAWTLRQYTRLFQDQDCQQAQQAGDYRPLRLAAAHLWGMSELTHGRVGGALEALQELVKEKVPSAQVLAAALSWSQAAIEARKVEAVLAWASHPLLASTAAAVPQGSMLLVLASALAHFAAGQFARGRTVLTSTLTLQDSNALSVQACFLFALSLLAETRNWAIPRPLVDTGGVADRRTNNRNLWIALRQPLDDTVLTLAQAPEELAWRACLLAGLVRFVDSSAIFDVAEPSSFGEAIEHIQGKHGGVRLKEIEGILRTRDRATGEAISCIQQNELAKLRTLQDQKLQSLGDGIPPLVRAAVYMTLWRAEAGYDPLPDLRRIPPMQDSGSLVVACIAQVQVTETLKRLAQLCMQPQLQDNQTTPELGILSHITELAWMGDLATAVLHLRQGRWRAALDALPADGEITDESCLKMARRVRFYASWQIGMNEITNGQIEEAQSVLQEQLCVSFSPALVLTATVAWSQKALEVRRIQEAARWLASQAIISVSQAAPQGELLLRVATVLTHFAGGQYELGRVELLALLEHQNDDLFVHEGHYLLSLSLLAETRSWAKPRGGESDDIVDEARVHNRTLWRTLRPQLDSAATLTLQAPEDFAWRGHLLAGLIAFVDSSATLSVDQVDRFSRAIEHPPIQESRARLKAIEGVLQTRTRATEEAVAYIRQWEYQKLRVLQDQVLSPLGDAIPPLVRAAVYLTLWWTKPSYDPVPDLQRIPVTPDNELALQECISQVQATRTLQDLTKLCKQSRLREEESLPSLGTLSRVAKTSWMGSLAITVLHLRQGQWRAAIDTLPSDCDDVDEQWRAMARYVRSYAAWQLGDLAILSSEDCAIYFGRSPKWRSALTARQLIAALGDNDEGKVAQLIGLTDPIRQTPEQITGVLTSLVLWLMVRRRSQDVMRLVNVLRALIEEKEISQPLVRRLRPWIAFFAALVAAQMGQHTASGEACEAVLTLTTESDSLGRKMGESARLIKLEANLALATQADDDLRLRWPSVQRTLLDEASALSGTPTLEAYGFLIEGLVSYLAADVLVNERVLSKLMHAQRVLPLARYGSFVQNAISRLDWRRRVIADFWGGLVRGDFKLSRSIYQREILPAFGERVPHPIQLGMIIVDWDTGQASTVELLKRLALLEHEAAELDPVLIQKTRGYIHEGDQVRHFTQLVKDNDFDGVIEFVERSPWSQGGIPIAVGIALLYAYYKKERMDEAEHLASILSDDPHFPDWVRNHGNLIVGYIYHRKGDFPKSAEAFEKIQISTLLGHNADKYWAVAHFADGLQKLKVDQKEDAFKAFRLSLSQRGAAQSNANLAPLFVHFGLKNIEARNGNQAQQAFRLMNESLVGLEDSPSVVQSRIVAQMGELLSRSLTNLTAAELPGGDAYLQLVAQVSEVGETLPVTENRKLRAVFHRMAIAQELRRQCLLENKQRKSKDALGKFLEEQSQALKAIERKSAERPEDADAALKHDPVWLVVQALIALRLKEVPDLDTGLDWLTQAARLGLQSRQLADLIQRIGVKKKETIDKQRAIVDLFDAYLLQGTVPPHLKDNLIRRDDLAEFYRASRNYTPRDLAVIEVQSSVDILERRVGHLVCNWIDGATPSDETIKASVQQLKKHLEPDGTPVREVEDLLNKIGNQLQQGEGDPSKILGMLCIQVVQMKELERSITSAEPQVMQHLVHRLQGHAATH